MKIVLKPKCKRWRIKLTNYVYLNIRIIGIFPLIWFCRDKRTVDRFFNYLADDAMWDKLY